MTVPQITESKFSFTLFSLPQDVLKLIIKDYLKPEERIALQFANKKLSSIVTEISNGASPHLLTIMNSIAGFGSIPLVEWTLSVLKNKFFPTWAHFAITQGNLELLKWVIEKECIGDIDNCGFPSPQEAPFKILKWLKEKGAWAMSLAAQEGHLEIFKWLHANGSPLDNLARYSARQKGQLHILKWIQENE